MTGADGAIANAEAARRYRAQLEHDLRHDPLALPPTCDRTFALLVISAWAGRYSRRRDAIAGIPGWADPLADTVARDRLVERWRARDAAVAAPPGWEPEVLDLVRLSLAHLHRQGRLDADSLDAVHGYGPSLRALWAEARRQGLDDRAAWLHIHAWARRPPAAGARQSSRLAPHLAEPVD